MLILHLKNVKHVQKNVYNVYKKCTTCMKKTRHRNIYKTMLNMYKNCFWCMQKNIHGVSKKVDINFF